MQTVTEKPGRTVVEALGKSLAAEAKALTAPTCHTKSRTDIEAGIAAGKTSVLTKMIAKLERETLDVSMRHSATEQSYTHGHNERNRTLIAFLREELSKV
jgi:hypothetical protein